MIAKLPFGRGALAVDLRGVRVVRLEPAAPAPGDAAGLAAAALDAPLDTPPLEELARGARRAAVLVPDRTRKVDLPAMLPVVLERLVRGGVRPEGITVLVACGTHPPAPPGELATHVGRLPAGVRVVQHDARGADRLRRVGELRPGVPLRLAREAVAADLLLSVSLVQHHYFAGFGGGPKMVFPGVAGYEEIQANHALVLDLGADPPRPDPRCAPGRLEGNPLAEEIARAAALRPADLALCLVAGRGGGAAWAAAGSQGAAFAAAAARARDWWEVEAPRCRLAVASAGGAPLDGTLIQAHKALDAACRFLEPGGEVLFVAALEEGPGSPDMEPFLADPDPAAIALRLAERYVQYGHTTLRLVEKARRHRIRWLAAGHREVLARLGFEPVEDAGAVMAEWGERYPGEPVAVMARGAVYPRGHDGGGT